MAEVLVRVVIVPDTPCKCVVAVVPNVVPVRVVMLAEVLAKLSIVALVDLSVVIVADVNVALVSDRLDTVKLLTDKFVMSAEIARTVVAAVVPNVVPVRVVMLAEVDPRFVTVALVKVPFEYVTFVPDTVPIVAEVAPNCVMVPLE